MLAYYLKLAVRDFRRNPGLTALMVAAIALGIAVCVMTLTVYQGMAGNPLWWKEGQVFSVSVDAWGKERPYSEDHPDLPPPLLTYPDATAIQASGIPLRSAAMYSTNGIVVAGSPAGKPVRAQTRVTGADFFAMFDVPFRYGGAWSKGADAGPEPVIVISAELNDKLFAGANSVGRSLRWNDREFRVVGVLAPWLPMPRFYDVVNGPFDEPDDAYLPFRWGETAELEVSGNTNCWKPEEIDGFKDQLRSECIYMSLWVELPDASTRERMQAWIDGYARQQQKLGRFERPLNNRLTPVSQWLADNDVVRDDNRVLVGLAFAFLAVCLLNTVGLLLAKFMSRAAITGVRRALGASRGQVFLQHLTEVGVIAALGGVLGLALGALLLAGLRALYAQEGGGGYQVLAHVDGGSILVAVGLALVATLAAGLYPAWRVGRLPPAVYLKSQ